MDQRRTSPSLILHDGADAVQGKFHIHIEKSLTVCTCVLSECALYRIFAMRTIVYGPSTIWPDADTENAKVETSTAVQTSRVRRKLVFPQSTEEVLSNPKRMVRRIC